MLLNRSTLMTIETGLAMTKPATKHLFERALAESIKDNESDERWEIIVELRKRNIETVLAQAMKWCASSEWKERELGADLLVLGRQEGKSFVYPKKVETKPILTRLLNDSRPKVIASTVYAVNHLDLSLELLDNRMDLAKHESVFVRLAMSSSIHTLEPTDQGIEMLLLLMADEDGDVRDWATFSVGTLTDVDNPEIRQALFARLYDPHDDTHSEAVIGLARRGDRRVIPALKQRFEEAQQQDDWDLGSAWLEAATEIAAPELLPYLEAMAEDGEIDIDLDHAIRRCRGEVSPDGVVYGLHPVVKDED